MDRAHRQGAPDTLGCPDTVTKHVAWLFTADPCSLGWLQLQVWGMQEVWQRESRRRLHIHTEGERSACPLRQTILLPGISWGRRAEGAQGSQRYKLLASGQRESAIPFRFCPAHSTAPEARRGKEITGAFVVFCLILFPGGWEGIQDCFHFLCISVLLRVM